MATIVLGGIGAIYGGPAGAAIGAVVGYAIDSELAQQGTREGPRLGDLRVQSSRYGSAIPKIFGRCRVSGTVVWSTDLIETRGLASNGKGKGNTANYSYAVSFAVMLSARQVLRVERIWADGNLLRGQAGDFKTATGFRLLTGDADEAIDPLIAAAEGIGSTPAYRGRTVAVFEDFQLAAYGNRVPSLSFEVVADEDAISVPALLGEISGGAISGGGGAMLGGIAVTGESVRGVAVALSEAISFSVRDTGTGLSIASGGSATRAIEPGALGAGPGWIAASRVSEMRGAALKVPEVLALSYYDATRDYLPGVQTARRDGGARREAWISLAAVLEASAAKQLVEARLGDMWRARRQLVVTVPWRAIDLTPGDRVILPDMAGVWRVAALAFEQMVVRLTLVQIAVGSLVHRPSDPGRSLVQPDLVHGATSLVILDLPTIGDTADRAARVAIAASGASAGWRGAPLLASSDGGVNFAAIGGTALPAIIGRTISILGSGDTALVDRVNSVDVQLLNGAMVLADADVSALAGGANLAMIGGEALQFGRADPLGGDRWRLSELWRGRRGTDDAVTEHPLDSEFVLIQPAALAPVSDPYVVAGLRIRATGVGDGANGREAQLAHVGRAITPLMPAHLQATPRDDGGFDVAWVRRSREGWLWRDGVDAPLGEEREAYRIVRTGAGLATLAIEAGQPAWTYSAEQRAADAAAGATAVMIAVSQTGSHRASVPARLEISVA